MKDLPLGKSTNYPNNYDPGLLVSINRLESRRNTGINNPIQSMYGEDAWTSYELSWLDLKSIPRNGILYLTYNVSSKNFIESKSLKLYLNSLNNKIFSCQDNLISTLQEDLDTCIQDSVTIEILQSPKPMQKSYFSLDNCSIERVSPQVNSLVLKTRDEVIEEKGVKVFVDSAAVMYLLGTEMDYKKEEFSSSFVFNNPNETERCGCGESFKI